jgi:glycosyltransferase involved in cell wall biosynthesis
MVITTKNTSLSRIKICYFGHYKPRYSRNRIIMKALRKAGAEIIEVNDQSHGILRYPKLFAKSIIKKFDLMIVGYIGHTDMPLAKLVCALKGIPVVFDAFLSLYEANVEDRRLSKPGSLSALRWHCFDRAACRLADYVLLDTNAHIQYFMENFRIPEKKFYRVWVGADDEVMYPAKHKDKRERSGFIVIFYGYFIPLHGLEHIIEAARILQAEDKNVRFVIVGGGQTYPMIRELVEKQNIESVSFTGRIPYRKLPRLIQQSDLCLGIFGATPKAQRVIPNKVYDGLGMAKCVITADTPAVREILTHGENIWLCEPGSGQALRDAILTLKNNNSLRESIARNGYQYFKNHFSVEALSRDLTAVLKSIIQK